MLWRDHVRFISITFTLMVFHCGKEQVKGMVEASYRGSSLITDHLLINHSRTMDTFHDLNKDNENRKQHNTKALVPFTGLTDSSKLNRNCCKNGGTCVLGSFCVCPKYYTGRYCEYDERKKDCTTKVRHGDWIRKGCSLCRCTYGTLHCFAETTQNDCDAEEEEIWMALYSNASVVYQTIYVILFHLLFFGLI